MKKLALTLTVTLACVAAFAQGKVKFVNDVNHSIYFTTDTTKLAVADAGLAGAVASVNNSSLVIELWGGASASSMTKIATTALSASATPGTWLGANVTVPGVAGGSIGSFEIFAYSSSANSYDAAASAVAAATNPYYGNSGVFQVTTGGSINYNSIVLATTPSFSTWAAGTQPVTGSVAGALGAIPLQANITVVPEPASLALFGLGAAGLVIFRRRK